MSSAMLLPLSSGSSLSLSSSVFFRSLMLYSGLSGIFKAIPACFFQSNAHQAGAGKCFQPVENFHAQIFGGGYLLLERRDILIQISVIKRLNHLEIGRAS